MTFCPRPPPTACSSNDSERPDLPPAPYPPTRLPAIALVLALAALGGCGDDSSGTGGGEAGTDDASSTTGGANTPPSLNGAAEIVLEGPIAEGASLQTPLGLVDAEGDAFTTELQPAPFVDGTVDGDALSIHVGYRGAGELWDRDREEVLARSSRETSAARRRRTP